jgi:hypothetical protein
MVISTLVVLLFVNETTFLSLFNLGTKITMKPKEELVLSTFLQKQMELSKLQTYYRGIPKTHVH